MDVGHEVCDPQKKSNTREDTIPENFYFSTTYNKPWERDTPEIPEDVYQSDSDNCSDQEYFIETSWHHRALLWDNLTRKKYIEHSTQEDDDDAQAKDEMENKESEDISK